MRRRRTARSVARCAPTTSATAASSTPRCGTPWRSTSTTTCGTCAGSSGGVSTGRRPLHAPDRMKPMASKAQHYPDMWVDPDDDPRESASSGGGASATDERSVLVEYLRHFRLTFEMKCDGLDAE